MTRDSSFRRRAPSVRQRGMTLIELLVGMTVGLIIILAAVASLLIVRTSSRTMIDSAALEQQATLAMLQINQQITQAGGYNAYLGSTNPDDGTDGNAASPPAIGSGTLGYVNFDTRPIGVSATTPTVSVLGVDGDAAAAPPVSDKLSVSYAVPNDGSPAAGCAGMTAQDAAKTRLEGGAIRIVSTFAVDPVTKSLTCTTEDDLTVPASAASAIPIASNVAYMRVSYLRVADNGTVTAFSRAADVTNSAVSDPWPTISGVQICLEMMGDITQSPSAYTDCQGHSQTPNDGRLHRTVRNTFYLRNF